MWCRLPDDAWAKALIGLWPLFSCAGLIVMSGMGRMLSSSWVCCGVFVHLVVERWLHWDCMRCLCGGESSESDEGNDG